MQQATVNLFADMGAQPYAPDRRAHAGDAVDRHDARRPRRSPRRPPAHAWRDGQPLTVTGTATDAGGGVVGGRRGLDRRRHHLAPGHRAPRTGPTPGSRTATRAPRSSPGRSTTAATSRRRRPDASRQRQLPAARSGVQAGARHGERLRRRQRGRGRREVPVRRLRRQSTGDPLLQGHREHRHPRRQPLDGHRHAARHGDLHRRDRLRLAAGHLRAPRCRSTPNTTYVASYFAPNGHYSRRTTPTSTRTRRRGPTVSTSTARRCTHCATSTARERRLPYGASSGFPTSTFHARPTTGSTCVFSPTPARRPHRARRRA